MTVLGLDIGGANLKAAHLDGAARTYPFAVWKNPHLLADELRKVIQAMPVFDLLAVTMTAELCDCYKTKQAGVLAILAAVEEAAQHKPVLVWRTDGTFQPLPQAREEPLKAAASNWLAAATFAGRYCPAGAALYIDIGSTTTDIVPLVDGVPMPKGRTDLERLIAQELVYVGVRRTPLCAISQTAPWRSAVVSTAAELFARIEDALVVAGDLPEDAGRTDTADGRPLTKANAHARLARMLCAEKDTFTWEDAVRYAPSARNLLMRKIEKAIQHVASRLPQPLQAVVIAGEGEFLARRMIDIKTSEVISLSAKLGAETSRAACAFAVAALASERNG